jgi:hypothetical protein
MQTGRWSGEKEREGERKFDRRAKSFGQKGDGERSNEM